MPGPYTTAQLSTILSEITNDPAAMGYAPFKTDGDVINLANMLNWVRDGATPLVIPNAPNPYPASGVIGPSGAITNATNATPIVVTSTAHGLSTGMNVIITGVLGNTNANGSFVITKIDANTFSLQALVGGNVAGNAAYTSGGTWQFCSLNFASLALPNNGQIPTNIVSAFNVLNAYTHTDLAASTPNAALCAWLNALMTATPNTITFLTSAGAENNVLGNLKAFIGAAQTTSIANLVAFKFRFGSRIEQILNLASLTTPGTLVTQTDVQASINGHY